jgi:hypothetical protein
VQLKGKGKSLTIRQSATSLNKKDLIEEDPRERRSLCPVLGREVRIRTEIEKEKA